MTIRERLQRELNWQRESDARWEREGFEAPRAYLQKVVLDHGREYVGIERPRGFRRQWARKQCFRNAAVVAMGGQATYVEDYAMSGTSGLLFEHAWLTVDGVHAIDQTLPDALATEYLGIPFATAVLGRALVTHHHYGILDLLFKQPETGLEVLGLSAG
jgi:hypothetical protein